MFSDQDIFVSISPQDTLLFSEMNDPILQNTFILNQTSVNLVLTRSYIALTTVVFVLYWFSLRNLGIIAF